jgi:hypothetical protein
VDTIFSPSKRIAMRQRNSYPKPFKAQVVQECLQSGASVASIALSHGINANVVRKWIRQFRDAEASNLPAFISLPAPSKSCAHGRASISIEIPYGTNQLTVNWPDSDPEGCAHFIRGLTR